MRYVFALSLLLLPATAFAQMFEGPTGQFPVEKCWGSGNVATNCARSENGVGLTASRDARRVDRGTVAASSLPYDSAVRVEAPAYVGR